VALSDRPLHNIEKKTKSRELYSWIDLSVRDEADRCVKDAGREVHRQKCESTRQGRSSDQRARRAQGAQEARLRRARADTVKKLNF
jgi:hypothetical protein